MRRAIAILAVVLAVPAGADAQSLSPDEIFQAQGAPERPALRIESIRTRFTHYDQMGHGYQSRATPPNQPFTAPGSEEVLVEQPQIEVVASQGARVTHTVWVPVDVVTAASPDAIDVVSTASHLNVAGSIHIQTAYRPGPATEVAIHAGTHLEENFRSWVMGLRLTRGLAEDNTVISASLNQVIDWLDRYAYSGDKQARVYRSTTNGNLGVTQLLSPTTVAHVGYGVTVQTGELGNTWNTVPLQDGTRIQEHLPTLRQRHALVGRLAQFLPVWRGAALKGMYRFYADDWGLFGHTLEVEAALRLARWAYVRGLYRLHHQSAVRFFTTLATPDLPLMTADSDLAAFFAQTFGGGLSMELPLPRSRRRVLADLSYERYVRTNDLHVNIYSCSLWLRF